MRSDGGCSILSAFPLSQNFSSPWTTPMYGFVFKSSYVLNVDTVVVQNHFHLFVCYMALHNVLYMWPRIIFCISAKMWKVSAIVIVKHVCSSCNILLFSGKAVRHMQLSTFYIYMYVYRTCIIYNTCIQLQDLVSFPGVWMGLNMHLESSFKTCLIQFL